MPTGPIKKLVILSLLIFAVLTGLSRATERTVISLNGQWQIAEGNLESIPTRYFHKAPVPGLVDMAVPAFSEVGQKSQLREVFWYQRTFTIPGEIPARALLKLHKAKFGIKVFINGLFVGDSPSCFTPNEFEVASFLRGNKQQNVMAICVGAYHDVLPAKVPYGHDFEKILYKPGIYDDVEILLSGTPHIRNVQLVPDIRAKKIRIVAKIKNNGSESVTFHLATTALESTSQKISGQSREKITLAPHEEKTMDYSIAINNCRLWSPEDPFLYDINLDTGADVYSDRFGMRSFRFDAKSRRAVLNDRDYFMRGTNVCIFRFFEDPERGNKPWDEAWVRKCHQKFKSMNWNSIRYCIGFPPEMWYRIADEEGLLIQDEYPVWGHPELLDTEILVHEYTKWMQSRWNHPCVVVWDAQNETITTVTGEALQAVRYLDLSNRPWDNGWSEPQAETDNNETHPYLFVRYRENPNSPIAPGGPLKELLNTVLIPGNGPTERCLSRQNFDHYPTIINEYGWLWLNRDGSTTTLTDNVYDKLNLRNVTTEVRLEAYAYYLSALTEYWRSHRKCAGVLHFCGLGYSRALEPRGQTSDHFINLKNLDFEPHFESYMKNAFAPVGLMIDLWDNSFDPGANIQVPVVVINDLDKTTDVTVMLRVKKGDRTVSESSKPVQVKTNGREEIQFDMTMPIEAGDYFLTAGYEDESGQQVQSFRKFNIAEFPEK